MAPLSARLDHSKFERAEVAVPKGRCLWGAAAPFSSGALALMMPRRCQRLPESADVLWSQARWVQADRLLDPISNAIGGHYLSVQSQKPNDVLLFLSLEPMAMLHGALAMMKP